MIKIITFTILTILLSQLTGCASMQGAIFDTGLNIERSWSGLDKKHITLSDHTWVYLEAGNASMPTVVLLHGFGADKDNWVRMTRHLEGFHVIAPDLPGHGDSSYNDALYYGMDLQSRRLSEFIDALHLKHFHLVGNSMGGAIASMYAYRHPDKVKTLSLICSVGFVGDEPSEMLKRLARNEKNPIIVQDENEYDALLQFVASKQPTLPWPARSVLGRRAVARLDANQRIFSHIQPEIEVGNLSGGFEAIFSRIKAPTYVLWGEDDKVLHVSSVDKFYRHIPHVETEIIPDIGHVPMIEIPESTAERLQRFWAEQKE